MLRVSLGVGRWVHLRGTVPTGPLGWPERPGMGRWFSFPPVCSPRLPLKDGEL